MTVTNANEVIDDLRLTEWTSCGGCAAKWGAALLKDLVADFPVATDPSLLVGLAPFDDAAIYQVSDDVALVSTTDFFPPLVDHPADFGAIAAANACSDVFAMGGRVRVAINVAAFPEHFPPEAIVAIFDAAAQTSSARPAADRRRPHDPQPGADLRPRRAGCRAPRPGLPQVGRRAGRRAACSPSRSAPG